MKNEAILGMKELGFPWDTLDPFLFCVHHLDKYPEGNEKMGPKASLDGRRIGNDFESKDGWSMYHGSSVPGFPQHPHRGFETITFVRQGLVDHADSMGAAGRYGGGDVQWMTAGKGIQHAEMFPLLKKDSPNTLELFQIWLNLPARDKMTEPHFSMFWDKDIPKKVLKDEKGRSIDLTVVAGQYGDSRPPSPPPKSWASAENSDVAVWNIKMSPNSEWQLPMAAKGTNRMLYFFVGSGLEINGTVIPDYHGVNLDPNQEVLIKNAETESELLLLQGRPIGEPVFQHGPFVMNTRAEVAQAFDDYQASGFGRWPWDVADPTHGNESGRFARHSDGREERPT